jgi:glucose-1-phosphate thymidylyltransferase
MKAVILAGGSGSRVFTVTRAVNKHILPVWDKPMIHYPIETVKKMGATEILLITNPQHVADFKRLLGTGTELGVEISYAVQERPAGIAQGILIAENWLAGQPFILSLGDNVLISPNLPRVAPETALVAVFRHDGDCRRFGVVNPSTGRIDEKPAIPKSNLVAIGLYTFPAYACQWAKRLKPSARNELEITDLLNLFAEVGKLTFHDIGGQWFDCGTWNSLLRCSLQVRKRSQNCK